jgi:hypothetical protein
MNNTAEPDYFAYHKVKRKFLSLMEVGSEKQEDIKIYEFHGQNFKLIAE